MKGFLQDNVKILHIWLKGYWKMEWACVAIKLDSIDTIKRTITTSGLIDSFSVLGADKKAI